MDELRGRLARGDLVNDVRRLLQSDAEDHGRWLRENIRHALALRRQDAVAVSALTGVAPGTVRGYLNGRPSSINNVLLIVQAVGCPLSELDRPPEDFRERAAGRGSGEGEAIGASLLAFDESPTPMAIIMLSGRIVKVNRQFCELLGYEEGELIGAPAPDFSTSSDGRQAERRQELEASDAVHGQVTELRRKDGSLVSALTSAVMVRDQSGEPRYIIARAAPVEGEPANDESGRE